MESLNRLNRRKLVVVRLAIAASVILVVCGSVAAAPTHYTGFWNNTTFDTSGVATFDVTVSPTDVTVVMDLDGPVFGLSDPAPLTLTGPVDIDGTVELTAVSHPMFGHVTALFAANGSFSGNAANIPTATVDSASFQGLFTPQAIHLDYIINFSPRPTSSSAEGTIDAAVPEPASLAMLAIGSMLLLSRHRRS